MLQVMPVVYTAITAAAPNLVACLPGTPAGRSACAMLCKPGH